ncbi:MAG: C39 family peptidase [Chloroflexi bacterium]|nr:C39 family peptidase [Chloroflexota bacterium]
MRTRIACSALLLAAWLLVPAATFAAPLSAPGVAQATVAPTAAAAAPTAALTKPTPAPAAPTPAPAATPPPPTPTPKPAQPTPLAAPTVAPKPSPTPAPAAPLVLQGDVFQDVDGNGERGPDEGGLAGATLRITDPNGKVLPAQTDDNGHFSVDVLARGSYRVLVRLPDGMVETTTLEQSVVVPQTDGESLLFGAIAADSEAAPARLEGQAPPVEAPAEPVAEGQPAAEPVAEAQPGPEPDGQAPAADGVAETPELVAAEPTEVATSDEGEQVTATRVVTTNLEMRFAPGRDTLAQVTRRVLPDGSLWLGVPFRTQIDGTEFQFVNCGPATLSMVLLGFGLDVEADKVRDYVNYLTGDYSREVGTSLDILAQVANQAGLATADLYSSRGNYRSWTVEAVRWQIQQGNPVMTLVKYRNLPGHATSSAQTDHYVVITGLTQGGFIYNDAAFGSTAGYGLEISDAELELAWDNSSIPRNAMALALPREGVQLSFPEKLPEKPLEVGAWAQRERDGPSGSARGVQTGEDPLGERLSQIARPAAPADPALAAEARAEGGRPVTDGISDLDLAAEPDLTPSDAAPMGLVELQPDTASEVAGPRRVVGQLALVLGALWAAALLWSTARWLARAARPLRRVRLALAAALSLFGR